MGIHWLRGSTKYKSGPAFQKIENSEVVAVMSRNGDKAKTYAKERGIPKWYDDAQELIDDEDVNAVYIATPPSSHATYAIMVYEGRQTCLHRKADGRHLRRVLPYQPDFQGNGCSMFCRLLPPLSALLSKSEVIGR